jgi:uncharacterized protein (DUF58 family)
MMKFYKSLFLTNYFYWVAGITFAMAVIGFFIHVFFAAASLLWLLWLFALGAELLYLYTTGKVVSSRYTPERLSNGDNNSIYIWLRNLYPLKMSLTVIDELPEQFQKRDFRLHHTLAPATESKLYYTLRPVKRGEYNFGRLNVFANLQWGMLSRKFTFEESRMVKVYPSFLKVRYYLQMSDAYLMRELGIKKTRRIGHTLEFDNIRNYVLGDDHRSINWKATARNVDLMVNQYEDEKAQQVYCIIDKGRTMKMPFDGLSLLDYSINAALMLCHVCVSRQDKAGLVTFSKTLSHFIKADNKRTHLNTILDTLYNQRTLYTESNYPGLTSYIGKHIPQRSLLVLFTNFESMVSLERQLPYLRILAQKHLLLVVFFDNTELGTILSSDPADTEEVYVQIIAEQFRYDKRRMVKILQQNGILALLTPPQQLTVNIINKYLEIKSRALI